MKTGQHVFVGPWGVLSDDHDGYWTLDGGDGRSLGVPVLVAHEGAIIPSHPQLRAVADWLDDNPDAAAALREVVRVASEVAVPPRPDDLDCVRGLVDALCGNGAEQPGTIHLPEHAYAMLRGVLRMLEDGQPVYPPYIAGLRTLVEQSAADQRAGRGGAEG